MTKTYSVKSNATRAARKAHPDGDFEVFKADNGEWTFRSLAERQLAKKPKHADPTASEKTAEGKKEIELHETMKLAYGHFNLALFDGRLPECMIILHRKRNARGCFWADQWENRDTNEARHEIALNPDTFADRTTKDILSTLVHEMTHLEQQVFGKPGKGGYHNRDWSVFMRRIGLLPYAVDGDKPEFDKDFDISRDPWPNPKQTGTKVSHVVVPGGAFDKSCDTLLSTGVNIIWRARRVTAAESALAKKKRASKTKFTCPSCGQNAWAKPDASIGCWTCGVEMEDQA